MRLTVLGAHDRQVSYIPPQMRFLLVLVYSSTFLAGLVSIPQYSLDVKSYVHRLAFQPLSFSPESRLPGHSCDIIELHVSVHIFALQDFSTTEHLSRSKCVYCVRMSIVIRQVKFPVYPDKAGKFTSRGFYVPMGQPGIRISFYPMRGSCQYPKANHFISGLGFI